MVYFARCRKSRVDKLPNLLLAVKGTSHERPLALVKPGNLREIIDYLHMVTPRLPFPVVCRRVRKTRRAFRLGKCQLGTFHIGRGMLYCNCAVRVSHTNGFSIRHTHTGRVPRGC